MFDFPYWDSRHIFSGKRLSEYLGENRIMNLYKVRYLKAFAESSKYIWEYRFSVISIDGKEEVFRIPKLVFEAICKKYPRIVVIVERHY